MAPDVELVRSTLENVIRLADRDLTRVWGQVVQQDAAAVRDALTPALQDITSTYGDIAATVAADAYDEMRLAAGVGGSFTAEPATLPGPARLESLARWGVGPLFSAAPDTALALSLISGGVQRIVADAHRDTVALSVARDPANATWSRRTKPDACDFCTMLAGRGKVYTSRDSALIVGTGRIRGTRKQGEKYHDHCYCLAVPSWS